MSGTPIKQQAWRFLVVGGLNTAVTVAGLALLCRLMDPAVAYTIVYAFGLAFTTVATNRYVFSAEPSWRRRGLFVGWYLAVYAVGLGVVHVLDARHSWAPLALSVATVAVTAPLSFIGGRLIFTAPSPITAPASEAVR